MAAQKGIREVRLQYPFGLLPMARMTVSLSPIPAFDGNGRRPRFAILAVATIEPKRQ
jgi:hypothetical protein